MKSELETYLQKQHDAEDILTPSTSPSVSYHARAWRVADRLSEAEIRELIAAFIAGTPKHELAKIYGINFKSVKNLLRAHEVRKPSGWNPRG